MTKTNTNKWTAPQRKGIRSVDISNVVYKPTIKMNPYLRTPSYRNRKSIPMIGTNAECY